VVLWVRKPIEKQNSKEGGKQMMVEPKTKPGIKTTEFWMTIAANLVGILILTGVFTPVAAAVYLILAEKVCGLLLMAVPIGFYIYSRVKAKLFTIGDIPWDKIADLIDNFKAVAEQVESMKKDNEAKSNDEEK